MFPNLEFIKTCLNAITTKFRRVESDIDEVQANVDEVQANVDEIQANVDEVKNTQPNWDEPNSASHAYIKNKPCYDYIEPNVVIWESDNAGMSVQSPLFLVDLVDGWLIEGETYKLTVDGVETTYTCAADTNGKGLYIGAGYATFNGGIYQSYDNADLLAYTSGLWMRGQKVRLEGALRRYKKLDTNLYDAVTSINGETGDVQITPENIKAANAGWVSVGTGEVAYNLKAIYGKYQETYCGALYLGGKRWLEKRTITDTGEEYFRFVPDDTILAGIKTPTIDDQAANKGYVDTTVAAPRASIRLYSSTAGSTKQFELIVNDDGVISAVEVTE